MPELLIVVAVVIAGLYCGLLLIAWRLGDRLMFPAPGPSYRPDSLDGLITLRSADGTALIALHLPNASARFTILYSHGNGEDLGNVLPVLEAIQELGFAVFAYDYRGYGKSEGRANAEGVALDAEAAYDHLTRELAVPAERIILWGRSVGGGPTVHLASSRPCAGMVLEATFTSAFCVVTNRPILPFDRFRNQKLLRGMSVPTLFIHGRKDRIVPFVHGERNFACAAEPKRSLWIERAGHNDLWLVARDEISRTLVEFAASLDGGAQPRQQPRRAAGA